MTAYEKQKRYRGKMVEQGRCPRCGKESFPYHYCFYHRTFMKVHRTLRIILKDGSVTTDGKGLYCFKNKTGRKGYQIKEYDPRKLARIENRPMTNEFISELIEEALVTTGHPMTEIEINEWIKDYKIYLSLNKNS